MEQTVAGESVRDTRKRILSRLGVLQTERSQHRKTWEVLARFVKPRRMWLDASTSRTGNLLNQNIINNTATKAHRRLAAGMMAGSSSPSDPWFRLTTYDPSLMGKPGVKQWLQDVRDIILEAFGRSNVYNVIHQMYGDLGWCGTTAALLDEDDETLVRAELCPVGSFCLALGPDDSPETLYREKRMTVEQLVGRFGAENCSKGVRSAFENGAIDNLIDVVHVVERNPDAVPGRIDASGMPWRSIWMESASNEDTLLYVGGFRKRPHITPRWEVAQENTYGDSPAMEAIGDIKQLQQMEKRRLAVLDKILNPPMTAPASMRAERTSLVPGDVTYTVSQVAGQKFEPAYQIPPAALVIGQEVERVERRIQETFMSDLFMMITMQDQKMTATEINAREQEKMMQLGPVLERLQSEMYKLFIERAFDILLFRGMLPPIPKALEEQEYKIEYISVLAEAQKLLRTVAIERLASFIINSASANPEVLDKLDFDKMAERYSDMLGSPPDLIRADDIVAEIRKQRAAMEQQRLEAEQAAAFKDAGAGAQSFAQAGQTGGLDMTDPAALQALQQQYGTDGAAA